MPDKSPMRLAFVAEGATRYNTYTHTVRCGTCAHWGTPGDERYTFRPCQAVKHAVVRYDDGSESLVEAGTQYTTPVPINTACVIDGSGYFAALKCTEDYGCVLYQIAGPTPIFTAD